MTITELENRIAKKQAQIEKKHNTIIKKEKQIAKKQAEIEKLEADSREARWLDSEIYWLKDDIERNTQEIAECEKTLAKYNEQLKGEREKEATFINEVPQTMKTLEQELVTEWDRSDEARRSWLKAQYKELGYNEFIKKHKYSGYGFMQTTAEETHKTNVKDARLFIIDLLNRVKDITGEVTDWSYITLTYGNTFPVLNGYVEGKEGRAVVESILAGGYNIQRLHIRTLVRACK